MKINRKPTAKCPRRVRMVGHLIGPGWIESGLAGHGSHFRHKGQRCPAPRAALAGDYVPVNI